ncbi:APC family permease [Xanthobacter oligotrophicus]|uniref:APC family permease n=1 Tax=Xanthobacter oligotrophicus TaxID=2607286 RepID=A0ABW6ZRD9_9HYPH|nr:APC family permease [Xanthobacter oligotrophicus]MCG5237215.1 APC family permease [Xanthobacter oligotrophicus]
MKSQGAPGEASVDPNNGFSGHGGGLKQNCLSYAEVLAQSVSVIAPSTVPAAIFGLIFASAGNGMWLSFLFGMVGMVLVSLNINQFARRSASPGSLYSYIVKGLGPTAGVLGGWALLFGYIMTGMSTLCGFAIFANVLLEPLGIHLPILLSFAIGATGACLVAYRDIQLSAKTMLVIEGVVLSAILILGILIWSDKGFAIDTAQLTLSGVTPSGVLTGVVLVVFGFSGFESSTSLGHEAKEPLRTIPRSVTQSVLLSGLVFIFMSYVVVLGFQGSAESLRNTEAPLDVLARDSGRGFLSTLINIGIFLSFFACTLACVNSTARIVFSMARHGLMMDVLGEAHEKNRTPYTAVLLAALVTFLLPAGLYVAGASPFDSQGYFGTLCSFGFLLTYILISLAAPSYLRSIGKLTRGAVVWSVLAIGFMALPMLSTIGIPGSEMFPPQGFPENLLFLLFILYMGIGLAWMMLQRARRPDLLANLRHAIDDIELKLAKVTVSVPKRPIE